MSPKRAPATTHSVIATTGPVPIDKLRPHPDNPNNGDTDAVALSLQKNGQYRPIVARVDGTILAGHHVYFAALELGWGELVVTFVDVDDDTATRIMIADNRTAELGEGVDLGLLLPLLQELEATTGGLEGTGYSDTDLDNLATLLDHGVWNPDEAEDDDEDGPAGGHATPLDGNEQGFWPKIHLQVSPAIFDAWRTLLDAHDGDNDVEKLTAYLKSQGLLGSEAAA